MSESRSLGDWQYDGPPIVWREFLRQRRQPFGKCIKENSARGLGWRIL